MTGLMEAGLKTGVPVLSVSLTPHHFQPTQEHQAFFQDHFVKKGARSRRGCRRSCNTKSAPERCCAGSRLTTRQPISWWAVWCRRNSSQASWPVLVLWRLKSVGCTGQLRQALHPGMRLVYNAAHVDARCHNSSSTGEPPFLCRSDDGVDGSALPRVPSAADPARPAVHGDGHRRCGHTR